jgi:hypothetical protein
MKLSLAFLLTAAVIATPQFPGKGKPQLPGFSSAALERLTLRQVVVMLAD